MLPDTRSKKRVLGGAKAGNGAWALAWIDTSIELPGPKEAESPGAQERDRLWKSISDSQTFVDLTAMS